MGMFLTRSVLLVMLLIVSCLGYGQSGEQSSTRLQELDANIKALIENAGVPSVAYAIAEPGVAPHIRVVTGSSSLQSASVNSTSRYRLASVSKVFAGIAIMQLVEKGQLNLDAPLEELLPEFQFQNPWASSHPLRLKHIVESTTGWDELSMSEFAYHNYPPLPLLKSLQVNPDTFRSRWPPGTRHAYSNAPATVAALVVEKLAGLAFEDYVQQHIFSPLGMTHTSFLSPQEGIVTLQGFRNGNPVPFKQVLMRPSGSASSSIQDMTRLLNMFIGRGAPLVSPATMARMERSEATNANRFRAGYGVFNYARYFKGRRYRGHEGALPGWLSELTYSPEEGSGYVILQNSEQPRVFRQITHLILDYLEPEEKEHRAQTQTVPEEWQARAGFYRYINPRSEKRYFLERLVSTYALDVNESGARLSSVFPPGWHRELAFQGHDRWQNTQGETVMVLAEDPIEGEVIHYGDRVFRKISATDAFADKLVLIIWLCCLLIVLVYSPVWLVNRRRGKIPEGPSLTMRKIFSHSGATGVGFLVFLLLGLADPISRLGGPGVVSVGFMLSLLLMSAGTVWGAWKLVFLWREHLSLWLRGLTTVSLVAQSAIVVYLIVMGVTGAVIWS